MLLAVDIGNTNIVLGISRRPENLSPGQKNDGSDFAPHWRLGTSHDRTSDEYAATIHALFHQANISLTSIEGIAVCSVVPPLQATFVRMLQDVFGKTPMVVGPGIKTGMSILYENPREVGADRIVNAVAAYHRFRKACLVVDFGTATTFDFVTPDGKYAGGAIAPGIAISAEALFKRASKLPRVDVAAPDHVIGRNTVTSIQSGLYYGVLGMVDRLVHEMLREAKLNRSDVQIIATGGLSGLLAPASEVIQTVLPFLTLEGLELIYRMNRGN